jgi:hypothetical protein
MKLIAIAFLTFVLLQSPSSLTGTWAAEKDGVTFIRLEFRSAGSGLSGALSVGDISLDTTGAIKSVKAARATMTRLSNIAVANGVVSFTWDGDSDENRFRLRQLSDGEAELTVLVPEDVLEDLKKNEGVPAPKPILLRKVQ